MVMWVIKTLWHGFWFLTKAFFALFVLLFMVLIVGCGAL